MLFINRSYIGKYMGFVVNRICSRLLIFNISNAGLGTEAEKVEKLSPFFFSTPRNLLIWDQVEMLCSCY